MLWSTKNTASSSLRRYKNKCKRNIYINEEFRPTSSKSKVENRESILKMDFTTTNFNQKWVTDITYIHTLKDGWCYLASVMDLFSKKIVGYFF
jgi:putative transposase